MCQKIIGHWHEKDHWLETEEGSCEDDNEMNFLLKEIWDGERFSELSWFCNPDVDWTLPAKCPESGCSGVISSCDIETAPACEGTNDKVLECPQCYNTFTHKVKHAKGSPAIWHTLDTGMAGHPTKVEIINVVLLKFLLQL